MGRIFFGLVLMMGLSSTMAQAQATHTHDVVLHVSDVFVPTDKNANGDAYVIVSGMYPSSCYRWRDAEVTTPSDNVHFIKSFATVNDGMCLTVMVPYTKEIILGALRPGDHTLRFLNGDDTYFERTLTVK